MSGLSEKYCRSPLRQPGAKEDFSDTSLKPEKSQPFGTLISFQNQQKYLNQQ